MSKFTPRDVKRYGGSHRRYNAAGTNRYGRGESVAEVTEEEADDAVEVEASEVPADAEVVEAAVVTVEEAEAVEEIAEAEPEADVEDPVVLEDDEDQD